MENLLKWRNRYSKKEYSEKVVLNIFYRKYTMDFMWNDIISCFGKGVKWNDFNIGFQQLKMIYSNTSTSKTHNVLMDLLQQKDKVIGNTTYRNFLDLIKLEQQGDNSKLEEIEYSYLYYLLTDESILLWAALGGTGKDKIDAIGVLSGYKIETDDIIHYRQADEVIGKLCSAPYLAQKYKALPPL